MTRDTSIEVRYDGVGNRLRHFGHNITGDGKPTFVRSCYNANNQLVSSWSPGKGTTTYDYEGFSGDTHRISRK